MSSQDLSLNKLNETTEFETCSHESNTLETNLNKNQHKKSHVYSDIDSDIIKCLNLPDKIIEKTKGKVSDKKNCKNAYKVIKKNKLPTCENFDLKCENEISSIKNDLIREIQILHQPNKIVNKNKFYLQKIVDSGDKYHNFKINPECFSKIKDSEDTYSSDVGYTNLNNKSNSISNETESILSKNIQQSIDSDSNIQESYDPECSSTKNKKKLLINNQSQSQSSKNILKEENISSLPKNTIINKIESPINDNKCEKSIFDKSILEHITKGVPLKKVSKEIETDECSIDKDLLLSDECNEEDEHCVVNVKKKIEKFDKLINKMECSQNSSFSSSKKEKINKKNCVKKSENLKNNKITNKIILKDNTSTNSCSIIKSTEKENINNSNNNSDNKIKPIEKFCEK